MGSSWSAFQSMSPSNLNLLVSVEVVPPYVEFLVVVMTILPLVKVVADDSMVTSEASVVTSIFAI